MDSVLHRTTMIGLERSCGRPGDDWIRIGASRPGFERVEASFAVHSFEPHRHDTYAIGITVRGVQSFGYRGTTEHSRAGCAFVIHPDELHDGHAGTDEGFRYRILYVEPRLIRDALDGRPLPFVREAVTPEGRLHAAICTALEDSDVPVEDLQLDHILVQLAEALAAHDQTSRRVADDAACQRAVRLASEYLNENMLDAFSSETLEKLTGLSRFVLCRQFRSCLGTSPHRYVVMRRLERARSLIRTGTPLARAAAESGFADQSHMTRHFKKAFGLSPGRWHELAQSRHT
jgi:AraC-like DNA-binding protein